MEEISAKTQMAKIRSFEKGFLAIYLIKVGNELGIFEVLYENKEGLTVPDLALALNLHDPYLKIWCQTAYYFEILDADDRGRFRLQPFLDEILGDKTSFRNYLANISVDVTIFGKICERMAECCRKGAPIEATKTPEISKILYEASKNTPMVFLYMILPKSEHLKQDLEQGVRFLDIGCGNGNLIIQLAQAFGNSTFIGVGPEIFDIESAKSTISELVLGNRVAVELMGGEDIPYEDEFHMVSMVMTLHEIPPVVREEAVRRAYRALKKDGHLLILDMPYPSKLEDFRNPLFEYGIFDQFGEFPIGNVHLNIDQQNEVISNAGFTNIQRIPIGKGMFDFITAAK